MCVCYSKTQEGKCNWIDSNINSRKAMVSTRNTCANKRKVESSSTFVAYDDTCVSLELPPYLCCRMCESTSCNLSKKGKPRRKNFRNTSKRNRCEQRWTSDYILIRNPSQSRLKTHYDTCVHLGISSLVIVCNGFYKQTLPAPKKTKINENDNVHQKSFPSEHCTSELDLLSTIASLQTTLPKPSQCARVSHSPNTPLHVPPHSTMQSQTIAKIKIEKQHLTDCIKNL